MEIFFIHDDIKATLELNIVENDFSLNLICHLLIISDSN